MSESDSQCLVLLAKRKTQSAAVVQKTLNGDARSLQIISSQHIKIISSQHVHETDKDVVCLQATLLRSQEVWLARLFSEPLLRRCMTRIS